MINIFETWADKISQAVITSKLVVIPEKLENEVVAYACQYKIEDKKPIFKIIAGIDFNKQRKTSNCIFRSKELLCLTTI